MWSFARNRNALERSPGMMGAHRSARLLVKLELACLTAAAFLRGGSA